MSRDLATTLRAAGWLTVLLLIGAICWVAAYWPIFDRLW
jgi:hypothetical protein